MDEAQPRDEARGPQDEARLIYGPVIRNSAGPASSPPPGARVVAVANTFCDPVLAPTRACARRRPPANLPANLPASQHAAAGGGEARIFGRGGGEALR